MLVDSMSWNSGRKRSYEVLDGASVTEVMRRYGVCRQTVHEWLHKYANDGFSALVDKASSPRLARIRYPGGERQIRL
ncbi:MAG: helix-turn-helix domain-containing protein [Acidimicrobiales bacterium]